MLVTLLFAELTFATIIQFCSGTESVLHFSRCVFKSQFSTQLNERETLTGQLDTFLPEDPALVHAVGEEGGRLRDAHQEVRDGQINDEYVGRCSQASAPARHNTHTHSKTGEVMCEASVKCLIRLLINQMCAFEAATFLLGPSWLWGGAAPI